MLRLLIKQESITLVSLQLIDIHDGNTHINEQIYQWNNQDIYSTNYRYQKAGDMNPYWSATLQFQNNKLVGKTDYNLQP